MADEIKTTAAEAPESRNFIHTFIEEDIAQGKVFTQADLDRKMKERFAHGNTAAL